jgi:hypothetical protein
MDLERKGDSERIRADFALFACGGRMKTNLSS